MNVPYARLAEGKSMGAQWSKAYKSWYIKVDVETGAVIDSAFTTQDYQDVGFLTPSSKSTTASSSSAVSPQKTHHVAASDLSPQKANEVIDAIAASMKSVGDRIEKLEKVCHILLEASRPAKTAAKIVDKQSSKPLTKQSNKTLTTPADPHVKPAKIMKSVAKPATASAITTPADPHVKPAKIMKSVPVPAMKSVAKSHVKPATVVKSVAEPTAKSTTRACKGVSKRRRIVLDSDSECDSEYEIIPTSVSNKRRRIVVSDDSDSDDDYFKSTRGVAATNVFSDDEIDNDEQPKPVFSDDEIDDEPPKHPASQFFEEEAEEAGSDSDDDISTADEDLDGSTADEDLDGSIAAEDLDGSIATEDSKEMEVMDANQAPDTEGEQPSGGIADDGVNGCCKTGTFVTTCKVCGSNLCEMHADVCSRKSCKSQHGASFCYYHKGHKHHDDIV